MKNLKFLTCKRHDALTWKNPWIDIKLHDLNFWTQVGLNEKQNKTKQNIKKEKKIKLKCKESSKWMTILYKGNPFIHGWMKYVIVVGMSTNFQLCKLTLFQIVFNYNSNFESPTNTLPPLLYAIPSHSSIFFGTLNHSFILYATLNLSIHN
jgi:hypothetical protein